MKQYSLILGLFVLTMGFAAKAEFAPPAPPVSTMPVYTQPVPSYSTVVPTPYTTRTTVNVRVTQTTRYMTSPSCGAHGCYGGGYGYGGYGYGGYGYNRPYCMRGTYMNGGCWIYPRARKYTRWGFAFGIGGFRFGFNYASGSSYPAYY